MTRVRARWVLGLGLVISGAAISCGSGDSAGLFTMSSAGADIGLGSSGAANQAGARNVAGDDGGAFNQSGGGSDQTSGAPGAGMTSTEGGGSGSPAGGAMGSAGKGGSTGKAGSGGGGAGSGGKERRWAAPRAPLEARRVLRARLPALAAPWPVQAATVPAAALAAAALSGGGGAGPVRLLDNAGCGESQYCAKPDCSSGPTGTCTARPIDCNGTAEAAVCGCDGFTYHDACLMHLNGQNSLAAGACLRVGIGTNGTVTCSSANDAACTVKTGGACGFRADTACPATLPLKGICWVLPATCPITAGPPKGAEVCNPIQQGPNSLCETECTAVKTQVRYAVTVMCN